MATNYNLEVVVVEEALGQRFDDLPPEFIQDLFGDEPVEISEVEQEDLQGGGPVQVQGNVVTFNPEIFDSPTVDESLQPEPVELVGDFDVVVVSGDDPIVVEIVTASTEVLVGLGGGSDQVSTGETSATVEAGGGSDTVFSGSGDDSVDGGEGNDVVVIGGGTDTVDGGEGFDVAVIDAGVDEVQVNFDPQTGTLDVVIGEDSATLDNTEFVQLDDGSALIVAEDRGDGTAARLFSTILKDELSPEALNATLSEDLDSEGNVDLVDFAEAIVSNSPTLSESSDQEFIDFLYETILERAADEGGQAFYLEALLSGDKTRGEILADLGWSDEAVDTVDTVFTSIDAPSDDDIVS